MAVTMTIRAALAARAAFIVAVAEQHYRRRIETVEELDTLPVGAIIRDDAREISERLGSDRWLTAGYPGVSSTASNCLPAVVLWTPGAGE